MNSTLRLQNSTVVDCYSVIAAFDGVLHTEENFKVPGTVELVGNKLQCFQGWRDDDRTVNFLETENEFADMQFPEMERELVSVGLSLCQVLQHALRGRGAGSKTRETWHN